MSALTFYDRVLTNAATANTTGNATWSTSAAQHAVPPTGISVTVIYTLLDANGAAWETGRAALTESGGTYTLTRGGAQTVTSSSNSGAAVSFTNSAVHTVFLDADSTHKATFAARTVLTTATTLPASTYTIINWDAVGFDLGGFWSAGAPSRLTVPAGVNHVVISAGTVGTSSVAGRDYIIQIQKNAGTLMSNNSDNQNWGPPPITTGPVAVNASDYFELGLWASTSWPLNVALTFLTIQAV